MSANNPDSGAAALEPPLIAGNQTFGTVSERINRIPEVELRKTPIAWWICFLISVSITGVMTALIGYLFWEGIGVWGVQNPVGWGFAIVNFVFWIGIGHAGTLISAILFLFRQRWRTSINRFAEAMTMAYHQYHSLDTRIARIFNTYGPKMRMKDGRVVPNFITQALKGDDLTVYGKGQQTRSFQYIDDLIDGLHKLLQSDYHLPVNLGNPKEMTILDFAKKVIELTGSKSSIIFRPLPQDDPQVRQPDISRAEEILGWHPRVSLDEGLNKTIQYFREQLRQ